MSWGKLFKSILRMEPLECGNVDSFCKSRCSARERLAPMLCKESLRSVKWSTQADILARAASDLCNSIDAWEKSVTEIIGRHPETGMHTQQVREALDNYFRAKNLELLGK